MNKIEWREVRSAAQAVKSINVFGYRDRETGRQAGET